MDEPAELTRVLRRQGFDATSRTTSIAAVDGCDGSRAGTAQELMARIVFVPAYPELPRRARERLAAALEAYLDGNGAR